jgi:antitoxin component of MazEF toxin-antitoxin module
MHEVEAAMGNLNKVQHSLRKNGEQWSIALPAAVARAMEFEQGEIVEWVIVDKDELLLRRLESPSSTSKKNWTMFG